MGKVVNILPYRERKLKTLPGMQEMTEISILKKQIVTLRNSISMQAHYIDREAAVIRISELQIIIHLREEKIIQGHRT